MADRPAAARVGDPVEHSFAALGLMLGLVAGAALGALAVASGGTALIVIAAIGGAAAGGGVGQVLGSLSALGGSQTGTIINGSITVFVNGKSAARCFDAGLGSIDCDGPMAWPGRHNIKPIVQGSLTVVINGMPATRVGDKALCSAKISIGSTNVYFGGQRVQTVESLEPEIPDAVNMGLAIVGIAAAVLLTGPVIAALALAGSWGGGKLGNWLGGKLFGEGSDGQKLMALGASMLGGMTTARFVGRPIVSRLPTGTRMQMFIRGGVPQTTPAFMRAQQLRLQTKKTMTTVFEDLRTGKVYSGTSGRPYPKEIHPDLRARMPAKSLEAWKVENCAEFKAVNEALYDGAKFNDLRIVTVVSRNGMPVPRCANCRLTTHGASEAPFPQGGTAGTMSGGSTAPMLYPAE
jgi:uncharacterized Zn-binding protein involved in type VI secretion